MQASTAALIKTALANDATVSSEHFAAIVQLMDQPVPAFLPYLLPRPLVTLSRLAREVGVSRWTIVRQLKEYGEHNLPPDCRPSTPHLRKMYPQALGEWFRQGRMNRTLEAANGIAPSASKRQLASGVV